MSDIIDNKGFEDLTSTTSLGSFQQVEKLSVLDYDIIKALLAAQTPLTAGSISTALDQNRFTVTKRAKRLRAARIVTIADSSSPTYKPLSLNDKLKPHLKELTRVSAKVAQLATPDKDESDELTHIALSQSQFRIMAVLAEAPDPMKASEIRKTTGLNARSTFSKHQTDLAKLGLLVQIKAYGNPTQNNTYSLANEDLRAPLQELISIAEALEALLVEVVSGQE